MKAQKIARTALGIGLRPPHYQALSDQKPTTIDFLEIIVENYFDQQGVAYARLKQIAEHYPLAAHGVSLNLLGSDPLDETYLVQVKKLIDDFSIPYASDHLCWNHTNGVYHHDLLPAPYHADLIPYVAERAAYVQSFLGVPFGIENLSSYLTWQQDQMHEWEFYTRLVEEAGCWYMLDINNIYVSSQNQQFDPMTYLEAINWDRVLQVHLAGHQVLANGIHHDTHDRPVLEEVWALYKKAWEIGGPFPTLIEWDEQVPTLDQVIAEAQKARQWAKK